MLRYTGSVILSQGVREKAEWHSDLHCLELLREYQVLDFGQILHNLPESVQVQ